VLLHDEQEHPLLVTTHRGDLHLTQGIPQVLASYEQVTEATHLNHLVVDREAMAADFLAQLSTEGRTMTTIRKHEPICWARFLHQCRSFCPLTGDRHGTVLREVAPAQFWLARASSPRRASPLVGRLDP
jgi:hypothetical protein